MQLWRNVSGRATRDGSHAAQIAPPPGGKITRMLFDVIELCSEANRARGNRSSVHDGLDEP
jgi:hypothetical protein